MGMGSKQRRILLMLSLVCILCAVAIVMAVYGTVFAMTGSKVMASASVALVVGLIGAVAGILLRKMRRSAGA